MHFCLKSKMSGWPARIRRKYEAPRIAALLAIAHSWDLDRTIWEPLLGIMGLESPGLEPLVSFEAKGTLRKVSLPVDRLTR